MAPREAQFDQHDTRLELIRPSLERVVLEAQQLELQHDVVLKLFSQLLAEKK